MPDQILKSPPKKISTLSLQIAWTCFDTGWAKFLCQPPLVSNWARGCWGTWAAGKC